MLAMKSAMRVAAVLAAAGALAADAGAKLEDLCDPAMQPVVLGTGYGFCEGPAADGAGNVYFSDGKKDTIHVYAPGKPVEVFVPDSLDANGMMFNARGELVVCEGAAFRIVAFDVKSKQKRILAGGGKDREFNEPNDLTIDLQGGLYFTDPNYRHRGQPTVRKEDAHYVAADGAVSCVSTVCKKPNGILLTPDNKTLYLADNGGKCIYRYDVTAPGKLANEKMWIDLGAGPDGMTLDVQGNLYVACGGVGVKVYAPDGTAIGVLAPGTYASNVVFGGPDFKTLFLTSRDKFLGLPMKVEGIRSLAP
jgi:gluconolactonase